MSFPDGGTRLSRDELAWVLAEIFDELPIERINEMLAKNVPLETLEFMGAYADDFADGAGIEGAARQRLPNLLLFGYLLRVVEDRLLEEDPEA
jgi:hypothetical protein